MNKYSNRVLNLFTSGFSYFNPGPCAVGIVITDHRDQLLVSFAETTTDGTNNQAEFKALRRGLLICKVLTDGTVNCHSKSQLLVKQLNGEFRIKDPKLRRHADRIHKIELHFNHVTFNQVPKTHPCVMRAAKQLVDVLDQTVGQ